MFSPRLTPEEINRRVAVCALNGWVYRIGSSVLRHHYINHGNRVIAVNHKNDTWALASETGLSACRTDFDTVVQRALDKYESGEFK